MYVLRIRLIVVRKATIFYNVTTVESQCVNVTLLAHSSCIVDEDATAIYHPQSSSIYDQASPVTIFITICSGVRNIPN